MDGYRGVFLTVILWLSDRLTGLPASVVALLPVIVFTTSGILDSEDLKSIEWDVLILIAGGISLGAGMQMSGLDKVIADWLGRLPFGGMGLVIMVAVSVTALSTFMSNTAAANLLLPIGVSATSLSGSLAIDQAAISLALAACMGFALPISTPTKCIGLRQGRAGCAGRRAPSNSDRSSWLGAGVHAPASFDEGQRPFPLS
jgi:Di- and tricarboxylate transporters